MKSSDLDDNGRRRLVTHRVVPGRDDNHSGGKKAFEVGGDFSAEVNDGGAGRSDCSCVPVITHF